MVQLVKSVLLALFNRMFLLYDAQIKSTWLWDFLEKWLKAVYYNTRVVFSLSPTYQSHDIDDDIDDDDDNVADISNPPGRTSLHQTGDPVRKGRCPRSSRHHHHAEHHVIIHHAEHHVTHVTRGFRSRSQLRKHNCKCKNEECPAHHDHHHAKHHDCDDDHDHHGNDDHHADHDDNEDNDNLRSDEKEE